MLASIASIMLLLGMAASPPAPTVPELIAQLESCVEMDCVPFRALIARGDKVWPELDNGLTDSRELVRFWSIGVLTEVPVAAARPRVMALLKDDPMPTVRTASAFALRSFKDAPEVTPALVAALADRDQDVRIEAAVSLGRRGPDATAVRALIKALDDTEEKVRAAAAESLGLLGDTGAAPALASKLLDPASDVRGTSAQALGELRAAGSQASLLAHLEREQDPKALAAAAWALGELADPVAAPALTKLQQHPSEIVRKHVAEALAKLARR